MTVFQLHDGNKQEGGKKRALTIKHTHAGALATHTDTQTAYK